MSLVTALLTFYSPNQHFFIRFLANDNTDRSISGSQSVWLNDRGHNIKCPKVPGIMTFYPEPSGVMTPPTASSGFTVLWGRILTTQTCVWSELQKSTQSLGNYNRSPAQVTDNDENVRLAQVEVT